MLAVSVKGMRALTSSMLLGGCLILSCGQGNSGGIDDAVAASSLVQQYMDDHLGYWMEGLGEDGLRPAGLSESLEHWHPDIVFDVDSVQNCYAEELLATKLRLGVDEGLSATGEVIDVIQVDAGWIVEVEQRLVVPGIGEISEPSAGYVGSSGLVGERPGDEDLSCLKRNSIVPPHVSQQVAAIEAQDPGHPSARDS